MRLPIAKSAFLLPIAIVVVIIAFILYLVEETATIQCARVPGTAGTCRVQRSHSPPSSPVDLSQVVTARVADVPAGKSTTRSCVLVDVDGRSVNFFGGASVDELEVLARELRSFLSDRSKTSLGPREYQLQYRAVGYVLVAVLALLGVFLVFLWLRAKPAKSAK